MTIVLGTTEQSSSGADMARYAITLDATYHPDQKVVIITYDDATLAPSVVALEILGMRESYREEIAGPRFEVSIEFDAEPKYGWAIHPIVADVDHPDFGPIQLKTEVHERGMPAPRTLYVER